MRERGLGNGVVNVLSMTWQQQLLLPFATKVTVYSVATNLAATFVAGIRECGVSFAAAVAPITTNKMLEAI